MPLTSRWSHRRRCTRRSRSCSTTDQAPVYVVHFTQAAALERAQALIERQHLHPRGEGRDRRARSAASASPPASARRCPGWSGTASACTTPGMLPKYRRLVEQLAQAGLLKVICGTDTLGVGINVPIRTVLFTGLTKYDGSRQRLLQGARVPPDRRPRRAGRLRHRRLRRRAGARARRSRTRRRWPRPATTRRSAARSQRKKPPEGFVGWTEETFERLVAAEPEPLVSRMRVNHAMLLNVIDPPGRRRSRRCGTCCDRQPRGPRAASCGSSGGRSRATAALLAAGVRRAARPSPTRTAGRSGCTVDLQDDFALNQPLSPFALAALDLLDPESPTLRARHACRSSRRPSRTRARSCCAQQYKARGEAVARDEGRRHRVRGADGAARGGHLAEAAGGAARGTPTRSTAQTPPVGRRRRALAQVGGARHVRAGDDLRRVRRASTAWPAPRGWCCATSPTPTGRCARPCPTSAKHRGARRPHRVARRDWSARSTPACSTSGSADRPRRTCRPRSRPHEPPPPPRADHRQRARLPRDGPQRDVPPGRAGRAATASTSSASSRRRGGAERPPPGRR